MRSSGKGPSGRTYEELHTKVCPDCNKRYPKTVNYFYYHKRGKYGPYLDTYCKCCRRKRQKATRAKAYEDPVKHEKVREQKRRATRKFRKEDPEGYRAAQRKWERKIRTDPKKHAALLERRRMEYRLRKMREGKTVLDRPAVLYPIVNYNRHVSVAPFLPIFKRYERLYGIYGAAEAMGVDEATLRKILYNDKQFIFFTTADIICTRLNLPLTAYCEDAA